MSVKRAVYHSMFGPRSKLLWHHHLRRGWHSLALLLAVLISAYCVWLVQADGIASGEPQDVPPTPITVETEPFPYTPSPSTPAVAPGPTSPPLAFPALPSPPIQAAQGMTAVLAVDDSLEKGILRLSGLQNQDGSWGNSKEVTLTA